MELCHCGKPLHYSDPQVQVMMERLITELGPIIVVTLGSDSWEVPRHYIALHGLRAEDLPNLGFRKVK